MRKKFKHIFSLLALLTIVIILLFSKIVSQTVLEGIKICTNLLIPSLFIFLIISEFFYRTNALNYTLKPFSIMCEKLFKIDRKIGPIAFFSLICGYPSGANLISNLVQEKKISKQTATRMLYFCVNSGPAFLISGVSLVLSNKITFGLILFASQIAAFLIVGTLSSIGKKMEFVENFSNNKSNITQALVFSVKNSIRNMAIICGFTLFFTAIINFFFKLNILNINSYSLLKPIFAGLLEVTNGVLNCTQINNIKIFLILSFITSFGGLCVHFQIIAIISKSKIPLKNFYIWRIIYCIISMTTSTILLTKFADPISTFYTANLKNKIYVHDPKVSISLIILSIALLFCEKKIIIIKRKLQKRNKR